MTDRSMNRMSPDAVAHPDTLGQSARRFVTGVQ
jgi:hypothetical protein